MFYLDFGEFQLFGASPEVHVKVRDGAAAIRPLAGHEAARRATRLKMRGSSRSCWPTRRSARSTSCSWTWPATTWAGSAPPGTVDGHPAHGGRAVFPRHAHRVARRGNWRRGARALDALRATFPAGTVSGAPKIRAIEVIDALEPVRRGFYAGAVAHVESDGSLDSCITIRCALKQGDIVTLQAGAGDRLRLVPEEGVRGDRGKARGPRAGPRNGDTEMIVIIDNYDSFTHNLYQYLRELTEVPVEVHRNDSLTVDELEAMKPSGVVISPGTGPARGRGHQRRADPAAGRQRCRSSGSASGTRPSGQRTAGRSCPHGASSTARRKTLHSTGGGCSAGCRGRAKFTRYHSLAIERESLPAELEVTAVSADGEIMGVRHRELLVEGIQFHPESIASEHGKRCLQNFLSYRREPFPLTTILAGLQNDRSMSREEAEHFMDELTDGRLTDVQIAGCSPR